MAFYVGQKVAAKCDGSAFRSDDSDAKNFIRKGHVYLIVAFSKDFGPDYLVLKGAPVRGDGSVPVFDKDAFRPLVERKTDIGFAHEILRPVTKNAPVDPAFERAMAEAYPDRLLEYVRERT